MHNNNIVVYSISDNCSPFFVINKVYLSSFVSLFWIYFINNTIWCQLNTLYIICHHTTSDCTKLIDRTILTYKELFNRICFSNPQIKIIYHLVSICNSIQTCFSSYLFIIHSVNFHDDSMQYYYTTYKHC